MSVDARGIVAWEVGAKVQPELLVVDEPGPGEILVRVEASGVCHTDLHIRNGAIGTLPILLGHEGAGIVEAVGAGGAAAGRWRLRHSRMASALRSVSILPCGPAPAMCGQPQCAGAPAYSRGQVSSASDGPRNVCNPLCCGG